MNIQEPSAGISSSAGGTVLFKGGSTWGTLTAFAVRHCLSLPIAVPGGKLLLNSLSQISSFHSSWGMNSDCRAVGNVKNILKKKAASSVVVLTLRDCWFEGGWVSWNMLILLSKRCNVQGFFPFFLLHSAFKFGFFFFFYSWTICTSLNLSFLCRRSHSSCFGAQQPGTWFWCCFWGVVLWQCFNNALTILYFSIFAGATKAWNLYFVSGKENCIKWRICFKKKRSS